MKYHSKYENRLDEGAGGMLSGERLAHRSTRSSPWREQSA